MDSLSYKTVFQNSKQAKRDWLLVDATGVPLGRLASRLAYLLRGKHKPSFSPHDVTGDSVVVVNADKIRLSGNKWDGRVILTHSGYPGGQKAQTLREIHTKNPTKLIEGAVKGMLPRTVLGRELFRRLHVYAGTEHPHAAQTPQPYLSKRGK